MGVSCIAVSASEFAPAIGIDAVIERQSPLRDRPVEHAPHSQCPEFDQVPVVRVFSLRSQLRQTGEFGGKDREEGSSAIVDLVCRAHNSLFIRLADTTIARAWLPVKRSFLLLVENFVMALRSCLETALE